MIPHTTALPQKARFGLIWGNFDTTWLANHQSLSRSLQETVQDCTKLFVSSTLSTGIMQIFIRRLEQKILLWKTLWDDGHRFLKKGMGSVSLVHSHRSHSLYFLSTLILILSHAIKEFIRIYNIGTVGKLTQVEQMDSPTTICSQNEIRIRLPGHGRNKAFGHQIGRTFLGNNLFSNRLLQSLVIEKAFRVLWPYKDEVNLQLSAVPQTRWSPLLSNPTKFFSFWWPFNMLRQFPLSISQTRKVLSVDLKIASLRWIARITHAVTTSVGLMHLA